MKKILLILIFFLNLTYSQNDSIHNRDLEYELTNMSVKDLYNTKWINIGGNYDAINSLVGINISNGFYEEPMIHFEDFQDNLIFKIEAQTDFEKDYLLETGIGLLYPIDYITRAQIEFSKIELFKENLELQDIHLKLRSRYFGNSAIILKTGFQKLQEEKNFGFDLGFHQEFKNFYSELSAGYYQDYFNLNGILHYIFYKNRNNLYSLRIEYDRIDNYNFLKFGFHWSFVRT